ncbi:MAG: Uma2 family endonuclease [Thermomicrobiales bacterium]
MVTIPQPITMLADREQRIAMTYDEFLARVNDSLHAEWIDGEVVIFMPPNDRHQALVSLLDTLLTLFVRVYGLGIVRVSPYQMRATPDGPAREPDLLFVAQAHLDRVTPNRLVGPADLVIEIISDESVARDRVEKFYEYQAVGILEYWLIDPRLGKERIDIYRLDDQGKYRAVLPDTTGRYTTPLLPGFSFNPDWLWQLPTPDLLPIMVDLFRDKLIEALGLVHGSGDASL